MRDVQLTWQQSSLVSSVDVRKAFDNRTVGAASKRVVAGVKRGAMLGDQPTD